MKSKIFFIIIIAASIAIIIGLALSGNDKPSDGGAVPTISEMAAKRQKPESVVPLVIPEGVVEAKKARMEEATAVQEQPQTPPVDRVDRLQSSVNNTSDFMTLGIRDRVTVISLALNMNDEQEVMLASYMEARQSFTQDRETRNFATAIINSDVRNPSRGTPNGRPEITLDQMASSVDIMALELKEIKALREKFLSELTKQQREKFEALPISAVF